jgi:hypothetical protein
LFVWKKDKERNTKQGKKKAHKQGVFHASNQSSTGELSFFRKFADLFD